jgi:pterin-4a-carbinolamine dehydratase
MATAKLTEQHVQTGLQKLEGWSVVDGNLHRVFEFNDFAHAFGLYDAGRARSRENGSPSGLVELLE